MCNVSMVVCSVSMRVNSRVLAVVVVVLRCSLREPLRPTYISMRSSVSLLTYHSYYLLLGL